MARTRKEQYEERKRQLIDECIKCRKINTWSPPTMERCDCCYIGQKLRWLETEYSDVTGWSHEKW